MARPEQPLDPQQAAKRRRGVRRTALVLFVIAIAIYLAFIFSGVFGVAPA